MAYSRGTVRSSSLAKGVYNPKAFFPHAALLRQAFAHCAKFLAAASRRSLGRVSVPVWLTTLSGQLWIVALVGRYPTNQLIHRRPLRKRPKALVPWTTCGISSGFPELSPTSGQVPTCYSPVRRCPPAEAGFSRDLHA